MPANQVGPHKFRPLRLWDTRPNGRCRACLIPASAHPVHCWVGSRALGDKSRAELSFAALSGEFPDFVEQIVATQMARSKHTGHPANVAPNTKERPQ